jgi:Mor transcription activator family
MNAPAASTIAMTGTGSTVLDDIAEVIGEAAALDLAFEFRGVRLYVPKNPATEPDIAKAIGDDLAAKLCHVFGGETVSLPKREAERRHVHYLRFTEKMSHTGIARRLKIAERQVYHLLKKPPLGMSGARDSRRDDRQLPLL